MSDLRATLSDLEQPTEQPKRLMRLLLSNLCNLSDQFPIYTFFSWAVVSISYLLSSPYYQIGCSGCSSCSIAVNTREFLGATPLEWLLSGCSGGSNDPQ